MEITEFEALEPERVDGVGNPANGVGFLMLKSVEENTPDEQAVHKALDAEIGVCLDDHVVKFVSAAQRRKDAKSGVAMPNGDFPIPDEGHLRSAIGRLAQYKGDKAAAKRHIIKRARALHLTHLLPEDWNVSKDAAKQTAPDKSVPEGEAESQTHEVDSGPEGPDASPDNDDRGDARHVAFPHGPSGDGQGDTAPDKALPTSEASRQTADNVEGIAKAEGDGRGDTAPDKDLHEDEAESQTRDDEEGNISKGMAEAIEALTIMKDLGLISTPEWKQLVAKADPNSDPGSPAWEHKDVALGEKAEELANQLMEVIRTFTEREKAEGGASKAQWRTIRRIRSLLDHPESLRKVAETMSTTELLKALDGLDEARRSEKKARKEKEAKKAAKREAKAVKAADKAVKAAQGTTVDVEALRKNIDALQQQVATIAAQDAKRPTLNAAGVTAVLRGPEANNALKAMDDRVAQAEERLAKAVTDYERQQAQAELLSARKARTSAILVAKDNARARGEAPRGRFGPNSADLFEGTSLTLPPDGNIKYF